MANTPPVPPTLLSDVAAQTIIATAARIDAEVAKSGAVAAAESIGCFTTLSIATLALAAIPADKGIYVTNDGAYNGFYVKRSGALVRESTATLPAVASAIDTLVAISPVGYEDDLTGWAEATIDAVGRVLRGINVGGAVLSYTYAAPASITGSAVTANDQLLAVDSDTYRYGESDLTGFEAVTLDAANRVIEGIRYGGRKVFGYPVDLPNGSTGGAFLGVLGADPLTRLNGAPLVAGDHYVNASGAMRLYLSGVWSNLSGSGGGTSVTDKVLASLRRRALAGGLPKVSASPPTITPGANGAATGIAGSALIAWTDARFAYSGNVILAGGAYPDYIFGTNRAVSYSATSLTGNVLFIDFCTDAPVFEIYVKGTGSTSAMKVIVDGELASNTQTSYPADGGLYLTKVDFGSRAQRRIRLFCTTPYFGGIRIMPTDTLWAAPKQDRIRAIFIGDSITEGPSGQNAFSSYAAITAQLLGLDDVWVSGVGATGYLAAPAPKLTFRQRLATDVTPFAPQVIVIAGGTNDGGSTDAQVQAECALYFDAITAALPAALVFVLGPWNPRNSARPSLNTAIKTAAAGRPNFYWVSNYEENWISGTGDAAIPNGTGNSDIVTSTDHTHPTPYGIEYLGRRLADALKTIIHA